MMLIGYSTGSLSLGDFRQGLQLTQGNAIELSALRQPELPLLTEALDSLDLSRFQHISVHAPSRLSEVKSHIIFQCLYTIAKKEWPVIVHPNILTGIYSSLPRYLSLMFLENMDKRKPPRTAAELKPWFERFPDARLCFDIGHAYQVDSTMTEAEKILTEYNSIIGEVHLSFVDADSHHGPLTAQCLSAFQKVVHLVPDNIPIILETGSKECGLLRGETIEAELQKAITLFERK